MVFSLVSKISIGITKLKEKVDKLKDSIKKNLASDTKAEKDTEEEEKKKRAKLFAKMRRRVLLIFLYLVDALLTFIDAVLIFCLAHFALIIAIVLVIVIVIVTLMPWITEIISQPIGESSEDKAIVEDIGEDVGGSSIGQSSWSEYELATRGTKLTNQEKNIYKLILLVKKYEKDYDTLDIHFTFGMGVSESGYNFYETAEEINKNDILKDPITNPSLLKLKDLSVTPKVYGYGGLFGMDLANLNGSVDFPIKDTTTYVPTNGLKKGSYRNPEILAKEGKTEEDLMKDAFVPYSVQRLLALNEYYWKSENISYYSEMADKALKAVGLANTEENKKLLMQMGAVRRSLGNWQEYAQNCYYFSAMIMKCASDSSGKVDLTRWGTTDKYEPEMRKKILGVRKSGIVKVSSVDDFETSTSFTLNGIAINCTMWQYFKKIWGNEDWWKNPIIYDEEGNPAEGSGLEQLLIYDFNEALDSEGRTTWEIQNVCIYHFAIARYLGAENIIKDITGKLTGGSLLNEGNYGIGKLSADSFAFPLYKYRDAISYVGDGLLDNGAMCTTLFGYDFYLKRDGSWRYRYHFGLDLVAYGEGRALTADGLLTTNGVEIASAGTGKIIALDSSIKADNNEYANGGMGNYVKILHDNGWVTTYMHLAVVTEGLKVGDRVTEDTIIGLMGTTGQSTGYHLHWQISSGADNTSLFINPQAVCRIAAMFQKTGSKHLAFESEQQINAWLDYGLKNEGYHNLNEGDVERLRAVMKSVSVESRHIQWRL